MISLFLIQLAQKSVGDTIEIERRKLGFAPPEITDIISFAIRGLLVIGGLLALLNLLLGGISWISSGGNKEAVEKAREKIQASIIGMVVLFAVVAIVVLIENVFNIGLGVGRDIKFPQLVEPNTTL